MDIDLPLSNRLEFGIQTINRRTEPATGPWRPDVAAAKRLVTLVDSLDYDSLWVGDHLAFAIPMLDPLAQLMQAATWSERLTVGVGVYLLPIRHPAAVAKETATLDLLTHGRFILGVGVGGEFPGEFELVNVPVKERGARLTEGIEVLRKLWSGEKVSHDGPFYPFPPTQMLPTPTHAEGPPIWCGGRKPPALRRAGRLANGYVSYVVTPQMYREALEHIARAAETAKRDLTTFATGHLLFSRIDDSYESAFAKANQSLSVRYAMDFSKATERYAACGTPEQVAERINAFIEVGVRHIVMDFVGPYEEKDEQIQRFADEVRPLLNAP